MSLMQEVCSNSHAAGPGMIAWINFELLSGRSWRTLGTNLEDIFMKQNNHNWAHTMHAFGHGTFMS